jgi:hypothetical protein
MGGKLWLIEDAVLAWLWRCRHGESLKALWDLTL